MGRLVGLELNNFKSYRGLVSVGFGSSNFTSIIGPNGSGKSNMMDAISFVLGVRSSRLRSSQLRDLIYKGKLNDDTTATPDSAYVMAIYQKDNGDVLKLKREIDTDSSSQYHINGKLVAASQYAAVLKQEHILIKAKNFLVFQGDVERLVSKSTHTLTDLVETISGSIEFKKEYDDLTNEKEKAHEETVLSSTKRRALRDELNQYKRQCREVDEFDTKTQQLKDLVTARYMTELYFNEKSIKNAESELKSKQHHSKLIGKKIKLKEKELHDFIQTGSGRHSNYKEMEYKIESNQTTLEENKLKLIPIKAEASQIDKRLKEYKARISNLSTESELQQRKFDKTKAALTKIQHAYHNFMEQQNKENEKLGESGINRDSLKEYEELREKFLMKGGHTESNLSSLQDQREGYTNKEEEYDKRNKLIETKMDDLSHGRSHLKTQLKRSHDESKTLKESIKKKRHELNGIRSSREKIQQEKYETNADLKKTLIRLDELGSLARETSRAKKLRESYASLKRLFPGVYSLLSDLCKPKQHKYALAVSTVIGRNMDAIVVSNLSVAAQCINYLKEQRAGSATFIPLDTVRNSTLNPEYRNLGDNVKPAVDLVQFDHQYARAVEYACSDTLICDTLDVAKTVRWAKNIPVKLVTLDGCIVNKSGIMTGGLTGSNKERANKIELNALLSHKAELKDKLEYLSSREPSELLDKNLLSELDEMENELPILENEQKDFIRKLQDNATEMENQQMQLKELRESVDEFKELKLKPLDQKIEETKVELQLIQQTIYGDFCNSNSVATINEFEEKYGLRVGAATQKGAKFQKEIERLKNRLSFEDERLQDYKDRLSKLEADEEKFSQDSEGLQATKKHLADSIDRLESENEVLQEDYEELQGKIKETTDESSELKLAIQDLKLDVSGTNKRIQVIDEILERNNMEKVGILKSCKMENVDIPLISGSLVSIHLGGDDNDNDDGEANNMASFNDVHCDFSKLAKKYKHGSEEERVKEIEENQASLREELSSMNPNINARERLDETQKRLDNTSADFNSVRDQEKKVISEFERVRKQRYDRFMKAFKHITEKIDPIYRELTKSPVSPVGGSAYLTLENEDEPYLAGIKYHAMPPLKRFRDMDLLSGGEKSIAALALLFAVHSFQPSPFFVLDEVDSALDNANVDRIAQYIKKHADSHFQFIVISLKNQLFEKSDALVGIYKQHDTTSSKVLTMDLRKYSDATIETNI